ncbi:MAG: CocE/NonD family hydrolase [Pseudonocardiaceae bacterium]
MARGTAAISSPDRRRGGVERDIAVRAADGTTLLADHHCPRGAPGSVVVWIRTPYGRKGMRSIAKRFAKRGAHVLVEAIRGTDGSGGVFDGVTFNPADGADVAAWLRAQSWFPGVIVTWGCSAIGYASWALAATDIPEWRLAILQDAQSELRDGIYPGGVFAGAVMLGFVENVDWQTRHLGASMPRTILASVRGVHRTKKTLAQLPLGTADQRLLGHPVDYFQQWLAHERDDDYWQPLNLRRHVAGMPEQVHLASGWYDICLASTLAGYAALRQAGKTPRLVIGPWYHGRGSIDKSYLGEIDACVDAITRGHMAVPRESVRLHVSGADEWREFPSWPPPDYQPIVWHLHPNGRLASTPATPSEPDRYCYDPADPTPAVGGAMENWDGAAGAKDNRKLEQRDDVLTYTSDTLPDDLEVIGPVNAEIVLRSSLEHTDLFARLCDVDPRGRSTNLCDGIRRLRPDDPPADNDGTRRVRVDLVGTAHRFRTGHRIRLQISSGAHPRLLLNPGTGAPLATATELQSAEQEIFHDPDHVSVVELPVRGRGGRYVARRG